MRQKTRLIMRLMAMMIVLLALGMRFRFIIIPALHAHKFWLTVGAFFLLWIAGR